MRTRLLLVAAVAASCARPAPPPSSAPRAPLAQEQALLLIPPGPHSQSALARLARGGAHNQDEAAWMRLHYLLDLFDDARFRRADDSAALLAAALERKDGPLRGELATDATVAALLVEADRILTGARLHRQARQARTLLEFDAEPPRDRPAIVSVMAQLKAIARAGGPLAANAHLRLFGWCARAFEDALAVAPALRLDRIRFCLYPLFDADPEPYFASDPAGRPPPPRWSDLDAAMVALANTVSRAPSRLAPAGRFVHDRWRAAANPGALPDYPTAQALQLPVVELAQPLPWPPVVTLDPQAAGRDGDALTQAMRDALRDGPPPWVAVALSAGAPADALLGAARSAGAAGARQLQLAVGYRQTLSVPDGDYWYGRLENGVAIRIGGLPVSLAQSDGAAAATAAADAPRALGWDPRRAALRICLVVERSRWRLLAPDGMLAEIEISTPPGASPEPAARLRRVLQRVRQAFADEDGLTVAIGEAVTYGELVAAAAAARHDANGRELFPQLALIANPPVPVSDALARRIDRRAPAVVELVPAALQTRAAIIRRCYQAELERTPELGGRFRVELRGGRPDAAAVPTVPTVPTVPAAPTVVDGPRHRALRDCVLGGVGAAMVEQSIPSAEITVRPR
jgi:hypothetical protein